MFITPGKLGFDYTDASREQFDIGNAKIVEDKAYPDVVFFGDSLLWYVPLNREPLTVTYVNRGIPGDVSPFMALRFAADVLQLQPKQVVLLGGVNDIINALLRDEPYEHGDVTAATTAVINNIGTMAQRAKAQGIAVHIGSILPIETPMGKHIDNQEAKQAIETVNAAIRKLCIAGGYHYIDFYTAFLDPATGYMNQALSVDGIHLKKTGYRIFLDILLPALVAAK